MRPTFQPNRLIQCGNLTHCRINISAHGYSSVHINGIQSKIYIFFAPCFHVSLYNSFYSSTPDRGPLGLRSKLPASEFMVHLLFFSALSDLTLFSVKGGRESSWMWNGVTFLRAGKTPPKHFTPSCGLFSPFPKKCTFAACRVLSRMFQVTQTNRYNHVGAFFILH